MAPSGHIMGLDLSAVLKTAQLRNYATEIISELIEVAEAVIVQEANKTLE
ncbi:DUF7697 family protein [Magnetococcales bacterium HHB-1]